MRHSRVLLNSNTPHETCASTSTGVMGKAVPFASSKLQQDGQLMPRKGISDVVSSLIGAHSDSCTGPNVNRSTKNTTTRQHIFDHVTVQPETSVVLGESPIQKEVGNKVTRTKNQQARPNNQNLCIAQTDVVKIVDNAKCKATSRYLPRHVLVKHISDNVSTWTNIRQA
nr:hypothetical protein [Tanacetum cinerariifolium]